MSPWQSNFSTAKIPQAPLRQNQEGCMILGEVCYEASIYCNSDL